MSGGPDCRTPGGGRPDGADLGGPQRAGPRQPRRVGRSRREAWSARQRARTRGVGPAGSAEVPRFRSPASGAPLDQITRIQQEVLVPLELWLIQRSEVETVTLRQAVGAACMRSTAATSAADETGRTVEFPLLAARLYRRGITTADARGGLSACPGQHLGLLNAATSVQLARPGTLWLLSTAECRPVGDR